jgi:hypothetical protein
MARFTSLATDGEVWILDLDMPIGQVFTQTDADTLLPLLEEGQSVCAASCHPLEPDGWRWSISHLDGRPIADVVDTDSVELFLALLWRDPE